MWDRLLLRLVLDLLVIGLQLVVLSLVARLLALLALLLHLIQRLLNSSLLELGFLVPLGLGELFKFFNNDKLEQAEAYIWLSLIGLWLCLF